MGISALTATDILRLDERLADGRSEPALVLLAHVHPDRSAEVLAELPLGTRNAALWALRGRSFGPSASARARCATCNTELELDVPTTIHGSSCNVDDVAVAVGDYEVVARLVTTADVLALGVHEEHASARAVLIARCVVAATHRGIAILAAELPPEVVTAVADRLEEQDPDACAAVACACAECGAHCELAFDVASFLGEEIAGRAVRIIDDIDALARAYGWNETEILALSGQRRRRYLAKLGVS